MHGLGLTRICAERQQLRIAVAALTACRQLELAVFVGMWAPAEASGVFTDKATLQAAVDDVTTAEATHGPLSGWDVSRVDDMTGGCCWYGFFPNKFNGDVSKWDTGRVTSFDSTVSALAAAASPTLACRALGCHH